MSSFKRNQLHDTRTPVYIGIFPESRSWWTPSSSHSHAPSSSLSLYKSPQAVTASHPSLNAPCRMRDIDPTVTFASPSVVIAKSSYIIILDGAPIHSEDTKLECIGSCFTGSMNPSSDGPLLYRTALVPKYWEILCKSPASFRMYTVLQTQHVPEGRQVVPALFLSSRLYTTSDTQFLCAGPNLPYHASHIKPIHPSPQTVLTLIPNHSSPFSHEDSTENQLYEQLILGHFSPNKTHHSPLTISKEIMAQPSSSSFPKDIRNYLM
ncbi:uncharacterized protein EDB91DRAFT_1350895 [Suillus paluster]|uniref:uncharacterized protein n=1 Tax=Suillus paluster TaxID=48578 RepID=UPI001B886FB7|nr:uncharacterized protein EDB91DRAFT_1350895 [Suillus paluster]KAG1725010.1 hypothetical protein EDB91DRAFT_1350895 [Suillus paluster]